MKFKEYAKLETNKIASLILKKAEAEWWDYVSAIRGPDSKKDNFMVKDLFTGFIRGNCSLVDIQSFQLCIFNILNGDDFVKEFKKELEKMDDHFHSHITAALTAISVTFGGQVHNVADLLMDMLQRRNWTELQLQALARKIEEIIAPELCEENK